jgi:hypothetical protein
VRDTSAALTAGRAIQNECAAIFRIKEGEFLSFRAGIRNKSNKFSSDEIDNIFRFRKYDIRIKVISRTAINCMHKKTHFQCFLKCLGENGGLVIIHKYSPNASNFRDNFTVSRRKTGR